jgi:uncharacterized membrane protein
MKNDSEGSNILTISRILLLITLVIAVALVVAYIYQWGIGLWADHGHWGEMGDFFGGMLNPIIALGALIMLFNTMRLQKLELGRTNDAMQKQNTYYEREAEKQDCIRLIDLIRNELESLSDYKPSNDDSYDKYLRDYLNFEDYRSADLDRSIKELAYESMNRSKAFWGSQSFTVFTEVINHSAGYQELDIDLYIKRIRDLLEDATNTLYRIEEISKPALSEYYRKIFSPYAWLFVDVDRGNEFELKENIRNYYRIASVQDQINCTNQAST